MTRREVSPVRLSMYSSVLSSVQIPLLGRKPPKYLFENFVSMDPSAGWCDSSAAFSVVLHTKVLLVAVLKVLLTVSVRFWKSIASHVSPIISPVRKPVSKSVRTDCSCGSVSLFQETHAAHHG